MQSPAYCIGPGPDNDGESESWPFTIRGFVELENFINTYKDVAFEDANQKNEIRGRLEIRYGTDPFYLYSAPDIYIANLKDYHYSKDTQLFRNLRYAAPNYEICFNELYVNLSLDNYRVRMGNQIYGWGTADVFNPTAYFNPIDLREIIFQDDDEYREGVPSISVMQFSDLYTMELVFVPVHVPGIIAANGDFWSLDADNYQLPIVFGENKGLCIDFSNIGYGARISTSVEGYDFSLSVYHGPDREPLFLPQRTVLSPNAPVSILVGPTYHVLNIIGTDFSMAVDDFVFQMEAAYSPDKSGYKEQDLGDLTHINLPPEVKTYDHIWYSAGFNYFIPLYKLIEDHKGETVFTFEWSQSKYLADNVSPPFLSKLISFRLEDSYFNNRINVSLAGIFDLQNPGHIIWPRVEYDFQNGFSTELSYGYITGKSDSRNTTESIFYYFRKNDILMWQVRYDF